MTWPIGYAKHDRTYRSRANGVVVVDGVDVTEPGGWLALPSPPAARAVGAPPVVVLQLRPRDDIRGRTYLYLGALRVEGREYENAHAMRESWVGPWLSLLAPALHAEVAQRVSAATASASPPVRSSGQYVRTATPGPDADALVRRRRTTGT